MRIARSLTDTILVARERMERAVFGGEWMRIATPSEMIDDYDPQYVATGLEAVDQGKMLVFDFDRTAVSVAYKNDLKESEGIWIGRRGLLPRVGGLVEDSIDTVLQLVRYGENEKPDLPVMVIRPEFHRIIEYAIKVNNKEAEQYGEPRRRVLAVATARQRHRHRGYQMFNNLIGLRPYLNKWV